MNTNLLNGQTALISGGLGDIGFATAAAMARLGADIALSDIRAVSEADRYVREIESYGVRCLYHQVDIGNPDLIKPWIDEVAAVLGIPQIIIANAAIVHLKGFHEISSAEWIKELNVNLNGAFFMTQHATHLLREAKMPGRVVFVGSWAAERVHSHMPAYSVAKAGVRMLCRCMALDLAPAGILVNEIAPGYVAAGLTGKIWKEHPEMMHVSKEKVPTRLVIDVEEVAEQIVYLCDPRNRHMTGSTLLMDGGLSL